MQTSYSTTREIGYEGMKAEMYPSAVETGFAGVAIKPGRFVVKDTEEKEIKLPTATEQITTGGSLRGVSLYVSGMSPLTDGEYAISDPVPVLRKGRVWLKPEDAVTAKAPIFVRFSAAGAEELGRCRSDADTADAVAAPNCYFVTGTSGADELCIGEINLP